MQIQRSRAVTARLDGDAQLHVWAPNQDESPFHVDLSNHIAQLIDRGRGKPRPPQPHWSDRGASTLIVELDLGAEGAVTIDGATISGRAAIRLATAGFHDLMVEAFGDRATGDPAAPAADEAAAPADDDPAAPAGDGGTEASEDQP